MRMPICIVQQGSICAEAWVHAQVAIHVEPSRPRQPRQHEDAGMASPCLKSRLSGSSTMYTPRRQATTAKPARSALTGIAHAAYWPSSLSGRLRCTISGCRCLLSPPCRHEALLKPWRVARHTPCEQTASPMPSCGRMRLPWSAGWGWGAARCSTRPRGHWRELHDHGRDCPQ
jgi:hypothetical protein